MDNRISIRSWAFRRNTIFDAKRIGRSGDTDVVVRWKDNEGKTLVAIVDGKSKSNGTVTHSDISDGLSLTEISLLFKSPNGLSQLDELISTKKRNMEIVTLVISTLKEKEETMDSLSARDLYFLLRKTDVSPSMKELIRAFEILSKEEIGVLSQVKGASSLENMTYSIGDGVRSVNRLRALATAIEKGLS